ncbi:MAG: YXWGXW repeat-containing protein [Holophagaceae bacterium]|nr:YXWGXW repeat-containing protein [Holophagaceae bacterium]
MKNRFSIFVIPALLVLFSPTPSFSQVRIGVDLGAVQIRIAPQAPPRPRWERQPHRPSANHVWIQGYWDRRGDQWAWAPGRWEEPARRDSYWIRPQYRREGNAYRYEPGRWSHQRMEEGDDYSRWHNEQGRGRGKKKGHYKNYDRDNDHRDH